MQFKSTILGAEAFLRAVELVRQYPELGGIYDDTDAGKRRCSHGLGYIRLGRMRRLGQELPDGPARVALARFLYDYEAPPPWPPPSTAADLPKSQAGRPAARGPDKRPRKKRGELVSDLIRKAFKAAYKRSRGVPAPSLTDKQVHSDVCDHWKSKTVPKPSPSQVRRVLIALLAELDAATRRG